SDSAVLELDAGSRHQVLDGLRDKHLAGAGVRGDACTRVDRDPPNRSVCELDLAGVDSGSHFEAERPDALRDRSCAAEGSGRSVEGREEAVACSIDFASAKALQLTSNERVVLFEQIVPAPVTELARALGRTDDVGEEDRRQDAVGVDWLTDTGEELPDLREHVVAGG